MNKKYIDWNGFMQDTIIKQLQHIEEIHNIKILYACESGSRAWGFPSKDSDYDVRFIYVHKVEYYLNIDPVGVGHKRDVIELPINDLLDITGWELTKTLKLFRKSNPALLEWLRSGTIYYQKFSMIEQLQKLSSTVFSPHSCLYHYLNMANNNFREYLRSDMVKIKKYFYVLRPMLAARWIKQFNEFPPLEFQTLLDNVLPEEAIKQEVLTLLERKLTGDELDLEPRIEIINKFLENEMIHLQTYAKAQHRIIADPTEQLNQLFRQTLEEVWM